MCSVALRLQSPLPPSALYAWVTRHLTASGSLNVTCWVRPLPFLIPSLSPGTSNSPSLLPPFFLLLLLPSLSCLPQAATQYSRCHSTSFPAQSLLISLSTHPSGHPPQSPSLHEVPLPGNLSALGCHSTYHCVGETSVLCFFHKHSGSSRSRVEPE